MWLKMLSIFALEHFTSENLVLALNCVEMSDFSASSCFNKEAVILQMSSLEKFVIAFSV